MKRLLLLAFLALASCQPLDPVDRRDLGHVGPRPRGQLIPPIVCEGGPDTCPEVGK